MTEKQTTQPITEPTDQPPQAGPQETPDPGVQRRQRSTGPHRRPAPQPIPPKSGVLLEEYVLARRLPISPDQHSAHEVQCAILRALGTIVFRLERMERLFEKALHETGDDVARGGVRRPGLIGKAQQKRASR